MKNAKILKKIRRAKRTKKHIERLGATRLTVHRSANNIYAQVISVEGKVLACASTLEKSLKSQYGGNIDGAKAVGQLIAERALAKGVTKIAFDRAGYPYHGRVKALAEAAREGGLEF